MTPSPVLLMPERRTSVRTHERKAVSRSAQWLAMHARLYEEILHEELCMALAAALAERDAQEVRP
jgi:hypothetical protein